MAKLREAYSEQLNERNIGDSALDNLEQGVQSKIDQMKKVNVMKQLGDLPKSSEAGKKAQQVNNKIDQLARRKKELHKMHQTDDKDKRKEAKKQLKELNKEADKYVKMAREVSTLAAREKSKKDAKKSHTDAKQRKKDWKERVSKKVEQKRGARVDKAKETAKGTRDKLGFTK